MPRNFYSGFRSPQRAVGTNPGVLARLAGQITSIGGAIAIVSALSVPVLHLESSEVAPISLTILGIAIIGINWEDISKSVPSAFVLIAVLLAATTFPWWHQFLEARATGKLGPADSGIVQIYQTANDFLPQLAGLIDKSQSDIMFGGASFYISLPQHKERLLAALSRGVRVRFLILDPESPFLAEFSRSFKQSEDELREEGKFTVMYLQDLQQQAHRSGVSGTLEVRLLSNPLGARFYIFDKADQTSKTYMIPYVNGKNSPNVPGLLLQNTPTSIAAKYFGAIEAAWSDAVDINSWLATNRSKLPTSTPSTVPSVIKAGS